jgi:hypothetical protein
VSSSVPEGNPELALQTMVHPQSAAWPRFAEVPEPRMAAIYAGNGSGTKLFQGFLDSHPQIYMVPAYPLMYLYPHWEQWLDEMCDNWNWPAIIDAFSEKHASVFDSRRIPGFNGLTNLGKSRDQHLAIDEALFRAFLAHLLEGEPITARTFLLAVHYAYAFASGEDLSHKRVLVYHIHVPSYVPDYLISDFPDALVMGTVRDPRSNIRGRYRHSYLAVDDQKLNRSDAIIYRRRSYALLMGYMLGGLEACAGLPPERVRVVRHEDLYYDPAGVMRATARFLGIDEHPCLGELTFGGQLWWGDKIYDMKPMNTANPRVVSLDWQKHLDALEWFTFEGLLFRFMKKYDYQPYKYRSDTLLRRLVLFLALGMPSRTERGVFLAYLSARGMGDFFRACLDEATGRVEMKDYTVNAYYRHKWTQKDLKLWKPRRYVTLLLKSRNGAGAGRRRLAVATYMAVNLCRYAWSAALCPASVFRRWSVSLAAFRRHHRGCATLPDRLA